MAKEDVKQAISETIVSNGKKGITAQSLSNVLNLMVDEGGSGGAGVMKVSIMGLLATGVLSSSEKEHNQKIFETVKNAAINNEAMPLLGFDYGDLLMAMEPEFALSFDYFSMLIIGGVVGYMSGAMLAAEIGVSEGVLFQFSLFGGSDSGEMMLLLPDGNIMAEGLL